MGRKRGGDGWQILRACPRCGRPRPGCGCDAERAARGPGLFRLRLEKRRGKPVTVAAAEGIARDDLRRLLKELRVRLATGGTVRDDALELQGDHRDAVRTVLSERGYAVRGG